jgi:histidyl-tRNA synthetase
MENRKTDNKDFLKTPKGMRDFFGVEFVKKQNFFEKAQEIAEYAGFQGIETPILEYTDVFTKGVGDATDIVEKEMYTLNTKGGDHLSLRPEGTAGVMRSYIEHGMNSLPQPVSVYYGGPFFRHEKPQKGRYRQLYQFGLEIIGSKNPFYDAHIMNTGYRIIKENTGLDIKIKINSLGNTPSRARYIAELVDFYKKHESSLPDQDKQRLSKNPLRVLDSKEDATILINQSAPKIIDYLDKESLDHFSIVEDFLKKNKIPYEIDHKLVRGLDYYSHTVFEYVVYDEHGNASFAIGGGGRYDGLAEVMGYKKEVPAIGIGIGVDRALELGLTHPKDTEENFCVLIELSEHARASSYKLTHLLQKEQIPISRVSNKHKLGEHLGLAEKEGFLYALVIGDDELESESVSLRDLTTRTQSTYSYKEAIEILKNKLD